MTALQIFIRCMTAGAPVQFEFAEWEAGENIPEVLKKEGSREQLKAWALVHRAKQANRGQDKVMQGFCWGVFPFQNRETGEDFLRGNE